MSAARLFVAAELPEGVRHELAAWGSAAAAGDPALRAVPAEALHVTLAFLGARPVAEVAAIARATVACAEGAVSGLALDGERWLGPRRPRVLAAALTDRAGVLAALRDRVVEAMVASAGLEPEDRPFLPHVTVARARGGAHPRRRRLAPCPAGPREFALAGLALWRSRTEAMGARYETVARVGLVGGRWGAA